MVRVIIEGDPLEWGKRFTELVCREWYRGREEREEEPPSPPPGCMEGSAWPAGAGERKGA